jgi:hypothetical protein
VENETEFKKALDIECANVDHCHREGIGQIETHYEDVNESDVLDVHSSSSPDITVKRSSYAEVDNKPSEDRHGTCLQLENLGRSPRARHGATSGGTQPRRSARRRKRRRVRSRRINGLSVRDHIPVRERRKYLSDQRPDSFGVGCSSLLVSCLKSLRDFVLLAHGSRYPLQKKSQRRQQGRRKATHEARTT